MQEVEKTTDEIRQMIRENPDASTRSFLLALQSVSEGLVDATKALRLLHADFVTHKEVFSEHVDRFDKHAVGEMKIINEGLGMWRIVAVAGPTIVSLVGAVGFYIMSLHLNQLTREVAVNESQSAELSKIRSELESMNTTVKRNTSIIDQRVLRLGVDQHEMGIQPPRSQQQR